MNDANESPTCGTTGRAGSSKHLATGTHNYTQIPKKRLKLLERISSEIHVPDEVLKGWYASEWRSLQDLPAREIRRLARFLFVEWFENEDGDSVPLWWRPC